MRRALLVTTGTVVGVAAVLAYKPSTDALALVPGAQPPQGLSGTTATDAALPPSTSAAPATQTPAATAEPATPTQTATPKATKKQTSKATARATSKASASASAAPASDAGAGKYKDGTYTGASAAVQSEGRYYGDGSVSVTVSGGKIASITFSETGGGRNSMFADAVQQYLVPEIIRTQNTRVGVVSGATGSSMALITSLEDALKQA